MCGIAGFYYKNDKQYENNDIILQAMLESIKHRGPDSTGSLIEGNLAIGMCRLSIIDLIKGDQPIYNEDKSLALIFNGEIYNFIILQKELKARGHIFSTNSDTEVIVHLYEEYGEQLCGKLEGMFAFCIYDRKKNILFFARDRTGKKPLYYSCIKNQFIFGSELKAIMAHPDFSRKLNLDAVAKFFIYGYIPAPSSILSGVNKLPAGHFMIFNLDTFEVKNQCYWEFDYSKKLQINESEILTELEDKLLSAVEKRLISDVPIGVFLSGGVDSSLIMALMSQFMEGKSIKSFTIGFSERQFDESDYARVVAEQYNTDHHVEMFELTSVFEIIDEATDMLCEPIADPSILPTYLLSKFTRENNIIVALSGDGGDEIFGGYPKYYIHQYVRFYDMLPKLFREKIINSIFHMIPLKPENNIFNYKVKRFLANSSYMPIYRNQFWVGPFIPDELRNDLFISDFLKNNIFFEDVDNYNKNFNGQELLDKMMYLDAKMMLQNMYLTKVDRASMAVSLEVRSPFLDTDVIDYAASIPAKYKVKQRETKYILKKMAENRLPNEIIYRFKKGFGIPLADWLKKMSGQILDILEHTPIDFLNKDYIKSLVYEHNENKQDHSTKIWSIYIFLKWHKKWME